jgi:hypothetical protein
MLAAYPAGRRPASPGACLPSRSSWSRRRRVLDTLTLPGLSRRRRWPPGLCQHDHGPEREAPVPAGDRAQQLITAPATADAGALARGGVPARDGAAPSHAGSNSGGSRTGLVPARRGPFGNLARARLDPRSSRHFCGRRGAGPGKDVPAGQNQARPLHV